MTVAEALLLALAAGILFTLLSGAGWLIGHSRPEEQHYVTIARLEEALTRQQARHDAAMTVMERRLDAAVARQDVLEREADEEREKRRADHARMAEMQRLIERWMAYARQLAEIIRRELKSEPPPEPPVEPEVAAPFSPKRQDGMAALAQRIAAAFSIEEINELGFELGLEGALTGETLERRASSLVLAATRRQLASRLVELCREKRPSGGF